MDKRRRILVILGSAALVFAALAGLALSQRAAEGAHRVTPMTFLPGFAERAKDAARIEMVGHNSAFTVALTPTGWVLPDRGNYPANFDEVRQTLITMAQLTTIAPKTSRPGWLHYLALDTPPAGTGTDITVKDASGAVLAHFLFGNVEDLGAQGSAIFVRRPGENQSWLAKAVFPLHGDIADWLAKGLFDIGPGRLQQVVVTPATGPGFTVGRARATEAVEVIDPKGGTPDPQVIDELGYGIVGFAIADVKPAAGMDFQGAAHVIARTFDGLAVTFEVTRLGDQYWTRISAAPAPRAPDAIAQEAAAINARTRDWAFRLPPQTGAVMMTDLKRLMTPPPPRMGTIATPGTAPPQ